MSTPTLFPAQAKSKFMTVTADRYRNMTVRLQKKGLPQPPFTLAQLRDHIYRAMGDKFDGALKCRYCGRVCDISEIALDHATPIERGGSLGLDNIDVHVCAKDNGAKGVCTAREWDEFTQFMFEHLPYARVDIIDRLAEYSRLLAKIRQAEVLSRIARGGAPKKKPSRSVKPPLISEIDKYF